VAVVPFEDDLSSSEKRDNDEETITMVVNPEHLKNTSKYNPETNQLSEEDYDPTKTKYIIMTLNGVTFTTQQLKELSDFIKKEEAKSAL